VIDQFCALLSTLYSKGIIHGDVKPSNLVLYADGTLRSIDFAEASLDSEPPRRHATTTYYVSPSSLNRTTPLPLADDMYAAAVTIWHIYTGRLPFDDINEDDLYGHIKAGLRPDLNAIDHRPTRALIQKYMQDGEPGA
jgi:serine/threonine protein kinase